MSELDKIKELIKRVIEYKHPEERDPPEESVFGPPEFSPDGWRMYRMGESYINFVQKVLEDHESELDKETGKFRIYEKSDPHRVDLRELIDAAYAVWGKRVAARLAKKKAKV